VAERNDHPGCLTKTLAGSLGALERGLEVQPGLLPGLAAEGAARPELPADGGAVVADGTAARPAHRPREPRAGRPPAGALVGGGAQAARAQGGLHHRQAQAPQAVGLLAVEVNVGVAVVGPQLDAAGPAPLAVVLPVAQGNVLC